MPIVGLMTCDCRTSSRDLSATLAGNAALRSGLTSTGICEWSPRWSIGRRDDNNQLPLGLKDSRSKFLKLGDFCFEQFLALVKHGNTALGHGNSLETYFFNSTYRGNERGHERTQAFAAFRRVHSGKGFSMKSFFRCSSSRTPRSEFDNTGALRE
jgi:hypothetical protein